MRCAFEARLRLVIVNVMVWWMQISTAEPQCHKDRDHLRKVCSWVPSLGDWVWNEAGFNTCWQNKERVRQLPSLSLLCVEGAACVCPIKRWAANCERRWSEASFVDLELGTAVRRPPTCVLHTHSPVMRWRGIHSELSTSDGEPFSHKRGEWLLSEKCPQFLFPLLALIPPWTQSNKNTRNDRPLPPPNSATGQNHFITLRPQGVRARQVQSYIENSCPLAGSPQEIFYWSILGTNRRGNEGKKELSGYFLVEISVVVDLVKTYYLRVKCIYTQLLHSQYKPFQT